MSTPSVTHEHPAASTMLREVEWLVSTLFWTDGRTSARALQHERARALLDSARWPTTAPAVVPYASALAEP